MKEEILRQRVLDNMESTNTKAFILEQKIDKII